MKDRVKVLWKYYSGWSAT